MPDGNCRSLAARPEWAHEYRAKLRTADAAVAELGARSRVYLGGNAATPRALVSALARRGTEVRGMRASHVLLLDDAPLAGSDGTSQLEHRPYFVGPADRDAVNEGRAGYVPCHLSEIPRILREDPAGLDAALLMTSPPDSHGFLSLGVEVLASLAAAEAARRVVVQVNERMPRVFGNAFLHVSEVDAIVEADHDLPELRPPVASQVDRAIAEHVVGLVPDRATLQLGIGAVPDTVCSMLDEHGIRHLGIHSEMISDGVMRAVRRGVVTGAHKTRHRRKVVTTFVLGTRELYDWVHENPGIEAHPCDHTNALGVAAQNDRLVAVNSAISVDLTGQVNADSIGSKIYSGVGGQVDFIRAAASSRGGVPIIALPSMAHGGRVSRIVAELTPGAGVVTSRADVHHVVTEYGVARMFGRSLPERAEALIGIAHPDVRDDLANAFDARFRSLEGVAQPA
mgnify:FL=1